MSGFIYLKLSKHKGSNEGNIIFDLDGGGLPTDGKIFPSRELNIVEGEIVLFPSSTFHKTVPWNAAESRVTLAFDVKPEFLIRS